MSRFILRNHPIGKMTVFEIVHAGSSPAFAAIYEVKNLFIETSSERTSASQ